ncbi:TerB family tellurite resistance protein [Sulfuricurvum sp.]|uniref:TerB family tellurite resistance protein n=1 Tax=Sulfuricurvum sp. TaxID=2025608 RepID=UPI003BAE9E27
MTQILLLIFVIAVFYWISKGSARNQAVYSRRQFQSFVLTKEHLEQSELGLFVALAAKIAKADGRVDELEAELISNMFNDISTLFPDPEATKNLLKQIFDEEKQSAENLDRIAQNLYRVLQNDPQKRQKMVEFLVNLSYIDGTLSESEEAMLRIIAGHLHIAPDALASMLSRFGSYHRHSVKESSVTQAYALLGLNADATNDAVKKAYRSLVREYHPDIIKAQGASDEYLKTATEKVQEINAAYEMIKKTRGM